MIANEAEMKKYPKINSLWKRDETKKYTIMPGVYSDPEFEVISKWHVTEKIDGTNIRVFYDPESEAVRFGGRTDRASIPTHLLAYLQDTFDSTNIKSAFPDLEAPVTLFGEGYGPKIQKGGGLYRSDPAFALFDVVIGRWWLTQEAVTLIAEKFEIPRVPVFGVMSSGDAIALIEPGGLKSEISAEPKFAEGIVCRSEPLLFYRKGGPVMWKLKIVDYAKLRQSN